MTRYFESTINPSFQGFQLTAKAKAKAKATGNAAARASQQQKWKRESLGIRGGAVHISVDSESGSGSDSPSVSKAGKTRGATDDLDVGLSGLIDEIVDDDDDDDDHDDSDDNGNEREGNEEDFSKQEAVDTNAGSSRETDAYGINEPGPIASSSSSFMLPSPIQLRLPPTVIGGNHAPTATPTAVPGEIGGTATMMNVAVGVGLADRDDRDGATGHYGQHKKSTVNNMLKSRSFTQKALQLFSKSFHLPAQRDANSGADAAGEGGGHANLYDGNEVVEEALAEAAVRARTPSPKILIDPARYSQKKTSTNSSGNGFGVGRQGSIGSNSPAGSSETKPKPTAAPAPLQPQMDYYKSSSTGIGSRCGRQSGRRTRNPSSGDGRGRRANSTNGK
jgi:hypothetical protein